MPSELAKKVAEALAGEEVYPQYGCYIIKCPLHRGAIPTLKIQTSRNKPGVAIECTRGCDTKPLYEQIAPLLEEYKKAPPREEVAPTAQLQEKRIEADADGFATPLSKIQSRAIEWLWEPYLPKGKLALLEGDPGIGKTWIALWICSQITREGKVAFYASGDDDPADTLRPRAESLGADLDHLFVTQHFTVGKNYQINDAVQRLRPALIVIDPIQSFIGAGIDIYKANEVRERLKSLTALCATHETTVLIVRHLRKTSADRALYRGAGSIDFTAAARSVLLVGQVGGTRAMVHIKSSLEKPGPSLAFELGDGFRWLGPCDIKAENLLAPNPPPSPALGEAMKFLEEALSRGPLPSHEIEKRAAEYGISPRTLRRAKEMLGVRSFSDREGGLVSRWLWTL